MTPRPDDVFLLPSIFLIYFLRLRRLPPCPAKGSLGGPAWGKFSLLFVPESFLSADRPRILHLGDVPCLQLDRPYKIFTSEKNRLPCGGFCESRSSHPSTVSPISYNQPGPGDRMDPRFSKDPHCTGSRLYRGFIFCISGALLFDRCLLRGRAGGAPSRLSGVVSHLLPQVAARTHRAGWRPHAAIEGQVRVSVRQSPLGVCTFLFRFIQETGRGR